MICIKKQTEFPRGQDDLREARSNFTASQFDQSEGLSLFQPRTNNERAWSKGSPEPFSLSVMRKREGLWGREWKRAKTVGNDQSEIKVQVSRYLEKKMMSVATMRLFMLK